MNHLRQRTAQCCGIVSDVHGLRPHPFLRVLRMFESGFEEFLIGSGACGSVGNSKRRRRSAIRACDRCWFAAMRIVTHHVLDKSFLWQSGELVARKPDAPEISVVIRRIEQYVLEQFANDFAAHDEMFREFFDLIDRLRRAAEEDREFGVARRRRQFVMDLLNVEAVEDEMSAQFRLAGHVLEITDAHFHDPCPPCPPNGGTEHPFRVAQKPQLMRKIPNPIAIRDRQRRRFVICPSEVREAWHTNPDGWLSASAFAGPFQTVEAEHHTFPLGRSEAARG